MMITNCSSISSIHLHVMDERMRPINLTSTSLGIQAIALWGIQESRHWMEVLLYLCMQGQMSRQQWQRETMPVNQSCQHQQPWWCFTAVHRRKASAVETGSQLHRVHRRGIGSRLPRTDRHHRRHRRASSKRSLPRRRRRRCKRHRRRNRPPSSSPSSPSAASNFPASNRSPSPSSSRSDQQGNWELELRHEQDGFDRQKGDPQRRVNRDAFTRPMYNASS